MTARRRTEKCANPFRKTKCGKTDIVVYVLHKNRQVPICRSCWQGKKGIAGSDREW